MATSSRRSYGSGGLFVRADSAGRETWYGSWRVGGRRIKRRIGLKRRPSMADGLTRTQAEAELRRLMANTTVVGGAARRTVEEAGTAYVDHLEHVMERKRTTIADYRGYLRKHLAPFFGGRPLDKIDRARVESYLLAKKRDGLSAKTIQNHLNFLHGIFSFSIKREWATANPVALVDRPKAPRSAHRRLRFLSKEDLEAVVRAVPDDDLGAVERPLYLCAAMTGLRQGELIGLRWCDIDWVAGRVRVAENYTRGAFDSPKSHRGRSVPMSDRLAGELERHFQRTRWRGERDLVFAHPLTGHVLDASKLRKRFRRAVAAAGVEDLTFHELRRTFGTRMAAAGAPLRSIQAWMGHADASTTDDLLALRAGSGGRGRLRRAGVWLRFGARLGGAGSSARPLAPLLRDPPLEVAAQEPQVLPEANARQLAAACRVVDPRRPHRQQLGGGRRGEQRLRERDRGAGDVMSELLGHVLIGFVELLLGRASSTTAHPSMPPLVQPPLQPHDNRAQIRMQLARPLERVEQHEIIDRALANLPHPIPLYSTLDQPSEVRRNRVVPDDVAELPPHLVTDVDPPLMITRPRSRPRRGRSDGAPACSSSHDALVARRPPQPPPASTRRQCTNGAIVCPFWRSVLAHGWGSLGWPSDTDGTTHTRSGGPRSRNADALEAAGEARSPRMGGKVAAGAVSAAVSRGRGRRRAAEPEPTAPMRSITAPAVPNPLVTSGVGQSHGVSRVQPFDRWFRYPAGFNPTVLEACVRAVGVAPGDAVVDPFAGAATVGTFLAPYGAQFTGIEAHPLIAELGSLKFSARPKGDLEDALEVVLQPKDVAIEREPILLRRCFSDATLSVLISIRERLMSGDGEEWNPHLRWALLGLLREVAAVRAGWPYQRPALARQQLRGDVAARMRSRARAIAADLDLRPKPSGRLVQGDAQKGATWRNIRKASFEACISSPPYLNNFDYADATRLELYFLGEIASWREMCERHRAGMIVATTQQTTVGAAQAAAEELKRFPRTARDVETLRRALSVEREKRPRGKEYDRVLPSYFRGIADVLRHLHTRLRPGARVAWVIGDSAPYGVYIDTPALIASLADEAGFSISSCAVLRKRGERWRTNGTRHQVALHEKMLLLEAS